MYGNALLGALTSFTITGGTLAAEFQNNDETAGPTGVTVETRRDNRKFSGTLRLRFASGATWPTLGYYLTVSGARNSVFNISYEIIKVQEPVVARGFAEMEVEVVSIEGITYTGGTAWTPS